MNTYQHILLATDFSKHSHYVAQKAYDLAQIHQAKLSIMHSLEHLPISDATYGPVIPFNINVDEELISAAKKRLAELAQTINIAPTRQFNCIGNAKLEIIAIAKEQQADLIIVGSHGRHGLALLLGSTANGVLHHAQCDVLAIRLQDS